MVATDNKKFSKSQILEKIKALMAKTIDNGCTEKEAESAAEMAQKLINKYNIDQALINQALRDSGVTPDKINVKDAWHDVAGGFFTWKQTLAWAIANANHCRIWHNRTQYRVVGEETDVELTVLMMDSMFDQCDRISKRIIKGIDPYPLSKQAWRDGFLKGMVTRLSDRLAIERQRMAMLDTNANQALVVLTQDKNDAIEDHLYGEGYSARRRANTAAYLADREAHPEKYVVKDQPHVHYRGCGHTKSGGYDKRYGSKTPYRDPNARKQAAIDAGYVAAEQVDLHPRTRLA